MSSIVDAGSERINEYQEVYKSNNFMENGSWRQASNIQVQRNFFELIFENVEIKRQVSADDLNLTSETICKYYVSACNLKKKKS